MVLEGEKGYIGIMSNASKAVHSLQDNFQR